MKIPACLLAALASVAILAAPGARAENLMEALDLALGSDPQLREAEANRMAALEVKPQARSALLPQVTLNWRKTDQDQDGTNSFFVDPVTGFQDLNSESEVDQDSLTLQLRQSVFRWDQWVALRQADARVAQAEVDYRAAVQDLMLRVARRYFDVLAAQDTLESTQATKEAVSRQLEQAETRFEVGLIAITDVREAQAAFDTAVADEIAADRALGTAKEILREFTGQYIDALGAPREDMPLLPPDPATLEQWVSTARAQNLSLLSSQLAVDIAREETASRRTGHYPTLDLVLSRNEFDSSTDQLIDGLASPSSNDFTTDTIELQFNVPIYSGGNVSSRVREAVYQERAAKERLERVSRETERLTRDSYSGVVSEISRVIALRKALESSETALEATEAGFEVGTRTTVDVLNARRDQYRARTSYLRSRYDYILNVLSLKLAAGILERPDIEQVNQWLD